MEDMVGIIGLGRMGGAMGANMIAHGLKVMGYARREETRARFREAGGLTAKSNADLARQCRFILMSLPSPASLASVIDEIKGNCSEGTCIMECSTLSLKDKQSAYDALTGTGVFFLDAPISGNGFQAIKGDLTVFFSGDQKACEACYPIMETCTKHQYYLGEFGAGMKMKMLANHLVTIHNIAAAEVMLFAEKMGMDLQTVYEVLCKSAGFSRMFESRGKMMVEKKYLPASMTNKLMQKDVSIIHEAIQEAGVYAPLFQIGYEIVTDCSEDERYAELDTAAAQAYLEEKTNSL